LNFTETHMAVIAESSLIRVLLHRNLHLS